MSIFMFCPSSHENFFGQKLRNTVVTVRLINKPQRGCPKRDELPDVNINTGVQSILILRELL